MPADQPPLPDGVTVLLGSGCLLTAFVGTVAGGWIAGVGALRRADRGAGADLADAS
jgi:hypothetical protein